MSFIFLFIVTDLYLTFDKTLNTNLIFVVKLLEIESSAMIAPNHCWENRRKLI